VHRRGADGTWHVEVAREGQVIELASVGCQLSVEEVYRDELAQA
jgi:hypothetical protein